MYFKYTAKYIHRNILKKTMYYIKREYKNYNFFERLKQTIIKMP